MRSDNSGPHRTARVPVVRALDRGFGAWLGRVLLASCVLVALAAPGVANAAATPSTTSPAATEAKLGYSLTPSKTKPYTPCPPGGQMIECNIIVDPSVVKTPSGYKLPGGGPLLEGGGEKGGFDPTDLQSAYNIPTSGGSSETVALIEAYGYKEAESDLAKYREKYGLAACTKASGCFKKVNQKGEEANYPTETGTLATEWSLETALDMDMVSAACPNCKILVVEATEQTAEDLAKSAQEAATLKATEISNSYGIPEIDEAECHKEGCKEYLADYNHAGIPVTASSGDHGYAGEGLGVDWPATDPNVIAVGGTSLIKAKNSRGWEEQTWNDSGSGCSAYEAKPAWASETACKKRVDSDVAAVASQRTPVSIYNTPSAKGWSLVGGTSVDAPLIAGIEAHANSTTKTAGVEAFYKHPSLLFDVSEASNITSAGGCGEKEFAFECHAGLGYDAPTGWGTPDGVPHLSSWLPAQEIPNSQQATSSLSGVSCAVSEETGQSCIMVGHYVSSAGKEVALAEGWTHHEWRNYLAIPSASNAKSSSLAGVSCTTPEACTAVGHYVNSAGTEVTLADRWNGKEWIKQETPNGKEAKSSTLTGVSCSGSTACTAVGHFISSAGVESILAERWNGTTWVVQEVPSPKEAKSGGLASVSCPASEVCTAVGHYISSTGSELNLVERWNGTEWKTQEAPGAKGSSLSGVACESSEVCQAAGRLVTTEGEEPVIESWNGTKWTSEFIEGPGGKGASLSSVGCGVECLAVGRYINGEGKELPVIYREELKKWKVATSPLIVEGAKASSLAGVACSNVAGELGFENQCPMVGRYVNSKNTEVMLGGYKAAAGVTVLLETPVLRDPVSSLPGVSCPASETCSAVGHYVNSAGVEMTAAEGWNGKEWKLQETPNPKEAKSSTLSGLSCTSSSACTAVGHYVSSTGVEMTLAERWNGTEWKIQETPNEVEAKSTSLVAVSCSGSEACIAVGHYLNGTGIEKTFAEGWNGKEWKVQTTQNRTTPDSLRAVSCSGSEACTAVGASPSELSVVERWNGKEWKLQEYSPGGETSTLSGVSCSGIEACTLVGMVKRSKVEDTLAARWNGATWKTQETPNGKEAKASVLSGLSCATATSCTTVGHYVNSAGTEVTLAEQWNGTTWAIEETTPGFSGAHSSTLTGVSCVSSTACMATGDNLTEEGSGLVEGALVQDYL